MIEAGSRAFNPRSRGSYYSNYVSIYRISTLMSIIERSVGWYCLNKATGTNLSRALPPPRAMAMVTNKETPSGAVSMEASANEGVAQPSVMT